MNPLHVFQEWQQLHLSDFSYSYKKVDKYDFFPSVDDAG